LEARAFLIKHYAPHLKENSMPTTDALLAEREKTHGDFTIHAQITQDLKTIMAATGVWPNLSTYSREALEMIAHKIGRILAGNPNFRDHWDDIAGYAKLVADRCPK